MPSSFSLRVFVVAYCLLMPLGVAVLAVWEPLHAYLRSANSVTHAAWVQAVGTILAVGGTALAANWQMSAVRREAEAQRVHDAQERVRREESARRAGVELGYRAANRVAYLSLQLLGSESNIMLLSPASRAPLLAVSRSFESFPLLELNDSDAVASLTEIQEYAFSSVEFLAQCEIQTTRPGAERSVAYLNQLGRHLQGVFKNIQDRVWLLEHIASGTATDRIRGLQREVIRKQLVQMNWVPPNPF